MLLAQQPASPQQAIPDAPHQQVVTLPDVPMVGPVTAAPPAPAPQTPAPATSPSTPTTAPAPQAPAQSVITGQEQALSSDLKSLYTITVPVNLVQVAFTVKDRKGNLVPGITWHDVHVYENNVLQVPVRFSAGDPLPLSMALVIDQSLNFDQLAKVNNALSAVPGAFAPYDEVAVFSYNNGPKELTAFTGAQSARLGAVLDQAKLNHGREPLMPMGGPLSQNIYLNGGANAHIDPNSNGSNGTKLSGIENVPQDPHTLTDAIYAAAKELAKTAPGRRRVIYVITDGKDFGNKYNRKDVEKYLESHNITVYATLVESAPSLGLGFLDHVHIPFEMRDNDVPYYAIATGGQIDREWRTGGIERSFAKLAEEVRLQYVVVYYSHEPILDDKFRTVDVRVLGHGGQNEITVTAEKGYYPTAEQNRAPTTAPTTAPASTTPPAR